MALSGTGVGGTDNPSGWIAPISLPGGNSAYPFTIAGWFRVPTSGVDNSTFFALGNSATATCLSLFYFFGSLYSDLTDDAGGGAEPSGSWTPDGQWHHFAIRLERVNVQQLYLDGVQFGFSQGATATTFTFDQAQIGFAPPTMHDPAFAIGSAAAEFVVFANGIETEADIRRLAQGVNPLRLGGSRLVSYHPLRGNLRGYAGRRIGLAPAGNPGDPIWTDHPPVDPIPAGSRIFLLKKPTQAFSETLSVQASPTATAWPSAWAGRPKAQLDGAAGQTGSGTGTTSDATEAAGNAGSQPFSSAFVNGSGTLPGSADASASSGQATLDSGEIDASGDLTLASSRNSANTPAIAGNATHAATGAAAAGANAALGGVAGFTRGAPGTYIGADRRMHLAAADEPRFDHDPGTGDLIGRMNEPKSTNFILNSLGTRASFGNDVNRFDWEESADVSLYDPATVWKVIDQTGTGDTNFGADVNLPSVAGTRYSCSLWVWIPSSYAAAAGPVITSGVWTGGGALNDKVTIATDMSKRDVWQRIYLSATPDTTGTISFVPRVNGLPGDFFYYCARQYEYSDEPTSYIPTSGQSETRAADNWPASTTNLSGDSTETATEDAALTAAGGATPFTSTWDNAHTEPIAGAATADATSGQQAAIASITMSGTVTATTLNAAGETESAAIDGSGDATSAAQAAAGANLAIDGSATDSASILTHSTPAASIDGAAALTGSTTGDTTNAITIDGTAQATAFPSAWSNTKTTVSGNGATTADTTAQATDDTAFDATGAATPFASAWSPGETTISGSAEETAQSGGSSLESLDLTGGADGSATSKANASEDAPISGSGESAPFASAWDLGHTTISGKAQESALQAGDSIGSIDLTGAGQGEAFESVWAPASTEPLTATADLSTERTETATENLPVSGTGATSAFASTWDVGQAEIAGDAQEVAFDSGAQLGNIDLTGQATDAAFGQADTAEHAAAIGGVQGFTRPSPATYIDASGHMRDAAIDEPRFDHDPATGALIGRLNEPERTNYADNPRFEGAELGVLGTPPTGLTISHNNGLSYEIVSLRVEKGLDIIGIRWFGTPTGNGNFARLNFSNGLFAAGAEEEWNLAVNIRLAGGDWTNINGGTILLATPEYDTNGQFFGNHTTPITPTNAPILEQRYKNPLLTKAGTGFISAGNVVISYTAGNPIDITFEFGGPQMEHGDTYTSLIRPPRGSPGRATRAADNWPISTTELSSDSAGTASDNSTLTATPDAAFTTAAVSREQRAITADTGATTQGHAASSPEAALTGAAQQTASQKRTGIGSISIDGAGSIDSTEQAQAADAAGLTGHTEAALSDTGNLVLTSGTLAAQSGAAALGPTSAEAQTEFTGTAGTDTEAASTGSDSAAIAGSPDTGAVAAASVPNDLDLSGQAGETITSKAHAGEDLTAAADSQITGSTESQGGEHLNLDGSADTFGGTTEVSRATAAVAGSSALATTITAQFSGGITCTATAEIGPAGQVATAEGFSVSAHATAAAKGGNIITGELTFPVAPTLGTDGSHEISEHIALRFETTLTAGLSALISVDEAIALSATAALALEWSGTATVIRIAAMKGRRTAVVQLVGERPEGSLSGRRSSTSTLSGERSEPSASGRRAAIIRLLGSLSN